MSKGNEGDNFSSLNENGPEISEVRRSQAVIRKQEGETKGGKEGETEEEKEPSLREKTWGGIKSGLMGSAVFISKQIEDLTGGLIKPMGNRSSGGYKDPSTSAPIMTAILGFGKYIAGKFSSVDDAKLTKSSTSKDGVEGADEGFEVGDKTAESIAAMGKFFEGSSVTHNPINSVEVDHVDAEEIEFKRGLAEESGLRKKLDNNMQKGTAKSTSSQVELGSLEVVGSSKSSGGGRG